MNISLKCKYNIIFEPWINEKMNPLLLQTLVNEITLVTRTQRLITLTDAHGPGVLMAYYPLKPPIA